MDGQITRYDEIEVDLLETLAVISTAVGEASFQSDSLSNSCEGMWQDRRGQFEQVLSSARRLADSAAIVQQQAWFAYALMLTAEGSHALVCDHEDGLAAPKAKVVSRIESPDLVARVSFDDEEGLAKLRRNLIVHEHLYEQVAGDVGEKDLIIAFRLSKGFGSKQLVSANLIPG